MPKIYFDTGKRSESIRYETIEISGKFVQFYDDLGEALYRVGSTCAMHLIYWMASNMGEYNQILMNKNRRSDFITACISSGGKRYSDETVKSAMRSLLNNRLIISMSDKGKREASYFVNPYYFWKTGSQKDRTESIKGFIYKLNEYEGN